MRPLARLLSIALHPLFMPVYTLALAMQIDPFVAFLLPVEGRWITLAMVTVMTVAFPLTSALLLKRAGVVKSLEMHDRQERIGPYVMTMVYYTMAWYLLQQAPLDLTASRMFAGATIAVALTAVITLRWKISAHLVGLGGLIGAVAGLDHVHGLGAFPIIAGLIVLAGVLGTARLLTSDHTEGQVIAGGVLGAACTYASVVAGWNG